MGELLFITPLLIYYIVIVPVVKIKIINDIERKKLRAFVFAVLLLLPIGDHLIGYVVYKVLCYTKGGVHIYKTVTDRKEQRDYWFYEGLNVFNNSYDDKLYHFLSKNNLVRRGICTKLIDKNTCAKGNLKEVYLNYCTPAYDTLPKTNPNYKCSCRHTQKIIKKYHLKNVIRVPKSKYVFDENKDGEKVLFFPFIGKSYQKIYNKKTGEILAEYIGYYFDGGWYMNTFNPFHPSTLSRCGEKDNKDLYDLRETVIPNPYKKDKR